MTDVPASDVKMPPSTNDVVPQTVERSQCTSEVDEVPCADRDAESHTQWACTRCREHLDRDFDEVLRGSMLTYQGWTEKQINAVGSLRQFDKTSWTDLMPDPGQPEKAQIRSWDWNCVKELQGRMDATRELHEIMTAQHQLQNQGNNNLTISSTNKVVCKDDNGNELHPEWTCHHCLARLDNQFDKLLREAMLDQGWTEARINAFGSLRSFDTKAWTQMMPNSSQSQLIQVRAWGSTRLQELEARMTNTSNFHKAMIGSGEANTKTHQTHQVHALQHASTYAYT